MRSGADAVENSRASNSAPRTLGGGASPGPTAQVVALTDPAQVAPLDPVQVAVPSDADHLLDN
eukprot:1340633-Alexandrium_andersonii.AAC.1